jgi:serine/threonine protein kinase
MEIETHFPGEGRQHMAPQPGDTLGAYTITDTLGSGGMATVYRARHNRLDRDAAVKVMHANHQADPTFLARFDREGRVLAQLDHPNIVPIYDLGEADGQPYIVMKYVEGQTLQAVLFKRPPSLAEIVRIVGAVAAALDTAHAKQILHRDVKPSNVMMGADGQIYLTDFGLARLLQTGESSMSVGWIIGSPNYISPEQARGDTNVTAATDVYSLGVMLYQMVVGRLPFAGETVYATVMAHVNEPPPIPSEVNPEIPVAVEMVLLQALEKDPARRYGSAGELAAAFKRAVEQSGLETLSDDRSGVFQPVPDAVLATPPPANSSQPEKPKPKRERNPGDQTLLLLNDEASWANLPREEIAQRRIKKRRDNQIGLVGHAIPYVIVNLFIVLGSLMDGDPSLGIFITPLAWGAGLAAHAITVYYMGRGRVEKLYRDFDNDMAEQHGGDWREWLSETDVSRAWLAAKERYEQQIGFASHAAVYVFINAMIWLTWIIASSDGFVFPYPAIVNLAWGFGLVMHGLYVRGLDASNAPHESIQAELDMMEGGTSAAIPEKRKHNLADDSGASDGELTDSAVDVLEGRRRRR